MFFVFCDAKIYLRVKLKNDKKCEIEGREDDKVTKNCPYRAGAKEVYVKYNEEVNCDEKGVIDHYDLVPKGGAHWFE